ncbi:MAG TPA: C45 family autoproteolytic acyltransferase/hydrolase [Kofleriaceae bacterium]|nr:C45 family autoproteolytic acyltransferase/hydrolase [Kofleriaceae bacterium]
MRTLELPAGEPPREWGRIHGESFRGEIQALAAIRTYLCTKVGGFRDPAQVRRAAEAHLPVLERYHAGLYEELIGIAEGAATSPADIVVANHYTDLRDLDPDPATWRPAPTRDAPDLDPRAEGGAGSLGGDGCSVIWAESPTGRILAQTWDMHATAIPYVMVLRIPASADGPAATLLTVTGCLGMAGASAARVGIAINNLYSTDATLGVVWPAIVRRALHAPSAAAARDLIAASPIGSGHHYFIADRAGAFAIEASGTRRKQVFDGGPAYCHTNHCIDPDVEARSKVPAASTTYDRMRLLEADLARAPIRDLDDAWRRLGSEEGWPRSVCTNMATPESPHGAATCGAIAVNLDTGELWAQQGFIHNVAAEQWRL